MTSSSPGGRVFVTVGAAVLVAALGLAGTLGAPYGALVVVGWAILVVGIHRFGRRGE